MSLYLTQNYTGAIKYYNKSLAINPNFNVTNYLGNIWIKIKDDKNNEIGQGI